MTSRADRIISILRTGHDDLTAFVGRLEPADLTRVSGASEWTVAQVLSHLGSGAEINLSALDAALGNGAGLGGDFTGVWARWDARSPEEQAAAFPVANERLVERYESLDDKARQELRVDLGFLPEPVDVATAASFRLNEFALHSWDVRVTFDPTATLAPEAVEPLLDGARMMLGFVGKADRLDGTARLLVRTSAPERTFGLAITDSVSFTEPPEKADGELTAPAEYVVRMITGRHGAAHTPAAVTLTGDAVTLDDLRRVFPGF